MLAAGDRPIRPRRLAPAAALLAAFALAFAACTGGGTPPAPTATPEASPAAEAPSAPAPTTEAPPTPSPAPPPEPAATPEPPPEQACANGVAVEEPEARPGLVADCVALLASRDALRGEAPLDWGGDLAIGRWEGVAVEGEPPRVTGLDLRDKGLTGSIPRGLGEMERLGSLILADNALTGGIPRPIGRLPWLDEVRLAGNALTGCVPSAFGDARGDAAYLGLPWCLRYDRLDATGEAAEAGEWAILGADGEVLATWEGLRSEAATLRVHQTDAGGTSWASEFGAVSEGGLFEWRKASDCWVRYRVTGPPVRPSDGSGRWEFPVEWFSYAPTGCAGGISTAASLRAEPNPRDLYWTDVTSPFWHGPYRIYAVQSPEWKGTWPGFPSPVPGPDDPPRSPEGPWPTDDNAEVRSHPYWREPDIPSSWILTDARATGDGVSALYTNANGGIALMFDITRWDRASPISDRAFRGDMYVMINGYPAVVYDHGTQVTIFDESTGLWYDVAGFDPSIRGNAEAVVAIAVSLLPDGGAP